jgi:hypothetical protein
VTLAGKLGDDAKRYQERTVRRMAAVTANDERAVFDQLSRIVDTVIELYEVEGKALPEPMVNRDLANGCQRIF